MSWQFKCGNTGYGTLTVRSILDIILADVARGLETDGVCLWLDNLQPSTQGPGHGYVLLLSPASAKPLGFMVIGQG